MVYKLQLQAVLTRETDICPRPVAGAPAALISLTAICKEMGTTRILIEIIVSTFQQIRRDHIYRMPSIKQLSSFLRRQRNLKLLGLLKPAGQELRRSSRLSGPSIADTWLRICFEDQC